MPKLQDLSAHTAQLLSVAGLFNQLHSLRSTSLSLLVTLQKAPLVHWKAKVYNLSERKIFWSFTTAQWGQQQSSKLEQSSRVKKICAQKTGSQTSWAHVYVIFRTLLLVEAVKNKVKNSQGSRYIKKHEYWVQPLCLAESASFSDRFQKF